MKFAVPKSDGSDSVVEKDALGLRSTRDVSKVMLTLFGCVIAAMVLEGMLDVFPGTVVEGNVVCPSSA